MLGCNNLKQAHNKWYTQKYIPNEQLSFALIIGKDQCSLICGETDKKHLGVIRYHYHSWGFSNIPVANGCVSEA